MNKTENKPLFVISDLHVGDCSSKDNLCHADRERLLYDFLDYVDSQGGQLIIAGDLFELFRYPLDRIIARRASLLDRLAQTNIVYIPGNHDDQILSFIDSLSLPHPFFQRVTTAFTRRLGERKFKFMHGHEVDPLAGSGIQVLGRAIGALAYRFSFTQGTCILSDDTVTDTLLEIGEQVLRLWGCLRIKFNKALRRCSSIVPYEQITMLVRSGRIQKMLTRYYHDKTQGLYDVAIVGHTHKAGSFDNWYFNSGSWTGKTNDFLKIAPDGTISIFEWRHDGPHINNTVLRQ
jgi:UDP-2,3-diacylglucosamine pyrophosphatase LpxH